ncbi:MAG: hypothetical protein HOW73_43225 [Polyangiaceae bacterium]|nr:hypothetical protein [Polyangiaceae bacterium]
MVALHEVMANVARSGKLGERGAALLRGFPELVERDPAEAMHVLCCVLVAASAEDREAKNQLMTAAVEALGGEPDADARCKECKRILPVVAAHVATIECGPVHTVVRHDGRVIEL